MEKEDNKKLTKREIAVLKHIAKGWPNEKIGEIEHISIHTVKAHISSIIKKLNARNRTHAAVLAVINNILENT